MKKYIRMDDFPHGKPNYNTNYKTIVGSWLDIFEKYNINYIFGVSPLLLDINDIEFLKNKVKTGKIVMHGFNHKFDYPLPWPTIVDTWKFGGEFMEMSEEQILKKYKESDEILSNFDNYDKSHFIPPFNCITQGLINVLSENGVVFLHTCDKEFNEFNYKLIDFKKIKPIISKYHEGYDDVHKVINRLNNDIGQITLHWIFDSEKPNWLINYENFAKKLNENIDYTRKW